MFKVHVFGSAVLLAVSCGPALAGDVSVAVAANFTKPAEKLGAAFAAGTGDSVTLSFGATGQLYTQISQGAPFEVFLAADAKRPAQAVAEGLGVEGTAFTYAVGKLVLYSPTLDVTGGEDVLSDRAYHHLAIADPKTAPYGAAAVEVLAKLGLSDAVAARLVTGESVAQTLQFVDSGNAELGLVALSQVAEKPGSQVWLVPQEFYAPILQDAVLTKVGEANPAARAFLDFLRSDEARAIIEKYGYEVRADRQEHVGADGQ